jgi:hypothetical protein
LNPAWVAYTVADFHSSAGAPTGDSSKLRITKICFSSSTTGIGGLSANGIGAFGSVPLDSGRRNQFNAGLEQAIRTLGCR